MKPAKTAPGGAIEPGGAPGTTEPPLNALKHDLKRSGPARAARLPRDKVALIHVAKHQVGMADDAYRAMLRELGGVASSTDLDAAGFIAVMARFNVLGFTNRNGFAHAAAGSRDSPEGMASAAQLALVRGLWRRWHGADDSRPLRHWLEGHYHVSDLRFADAATAQKAIEGLKAMLSRKAGKKINPAQRQTIKE